MAFNAAGDSAAVLKALRYFFPLYRTTEYATFLIELKKRGLPLAGFDLQSFNARALLDGNYPCLPEDLVRYDSMLHGLLRRADGEEYPDAASATVRELRAAYVDMLDCLRRVPDKDESSIFLELSLQNRIERLDLLVERQSFWRLRDSLMADRICRIDSLLGLRPLLLSGADAHLCTCPCRAHDRPAGQLLQQRYGRAYYYLAFTGFGGRVLNIRLQEKAVNFVETEHDRALFREYGGPFGFSTRSTKPTLQLAYYRQPVRECADYLYFLPRLTPARLLWP